MALAQIMSLGVSPIRKIIAAADFFFRMHYLQTAQGDFGKFAAVFAKFAADGVVAVEVFVDSVPLQLLNKHR